MQRESGSAIGICVAEYLQLELPGDRLQPYGICKSWTGPKGSDLVVSIHARCRTRSLQLQESPIAHASGECQNGRSGTIA